MAAVTALPVTAAVAAPPTLAADTERHDHGKRNEVRQVSSAGRMFGDRFSRPPGSSIW